ncbi:hypothetical protein GCM10022221_65880 [Actinocorallia aurea]
MAGPPALTDEAELASLRVERRWGVRAERLDLAEGGIALDDGTEVPFDRLVVATGSAARMPQDLPDLDGVFCLRTLDDAAALHTELRRARRPVLLGGGFIGLEIATAARALGLAPVVLEQAPLPLSRFGAEIGRAVLEAHRRQGVDLRTGCAVVAVEGRERVERVVLADGAVVETDLLIVGTGAAPATSWLKGSGVAVDDGVVCDSACRSVSDPRIFAAGDVCRWDNPLFGRAMRVEHRQVALRHADTVAAAITGDATAAAAFAPYFWSDQAGTKIQFHGHLRPGDLLHHLHRDGDRLAALYSCDGILTGALTIGAPAWSPRLARHVAARAAPETALATLTGAPSRTTPPRPSPVESR